MKGGGGDKVGGGLEGKDGGAGRRNRINGAGPITNSELAGTLMDPNGAGSVEVNRSTL